MSLTVRYTDQANADLFRNAHWWARNHSLDEALAWECAIEQQILTLHEMPERHGLAPENEDFPYEIRQKLVGSGPRPSYRAVFTIHENAVYVLTIRRGSQDALTPDEVDFEPQ